MKAAPSHLHLAPPTKAAPTQPGTAPLGDATACEQASRAARQAETAAGLERAERERDFLRATDDAAKAEEKFRHLRQIQTAHAEAYAHASHKSTAGLLQADQERLQAKQAAHDLLLAQQNAAYREAEATKARVLSDANAQAAREHEQYLQQLRADQLRQQRQQQADRERAEAHAAEAHRIQLQADRESAEMQAAGHTASPRHKPRPKPWPSCRG